ncbi:MAG: hypothetical protein LBT05_11735 [Planctomycetaceae bacterium]|jgi:hypothetical protein|nr:hypothetical protein [Planctomycetaceae bacterium]
MIISSQAIDTIYQKVLELLSQHGVVENEPFHQSVLSRNLHFAGYRFIGKDIQVEWLAQQFLIIVRNNEGKIIFEHKLPEALLQCTSSDVLQFNNAKSSVVAV